MKKKKLVTARFNIFVYVRSIHWFGNVIHIFWYSIRLKGYHHLLCTHSAAIYNIHYKILTNGAVILTNVQFSILKSISTPTCAKTMNETWECKLKQKFNLTKDQHNSSFDYM